MEFAVGSDPMTADAAAAGMQLATAGPGMFSLQFQERKNLGDVQRRFESSNDLSNWTEVIARPNHHGGKSSQCLCASGDVSRAGRAFLFFG